MIHTEFGEDQSRPSIFRLIWIKKKILSCYQILKFRYIHEASSVRKPKSSNILFQRKNFVKSVRKQYGNPESHAFYFRNRKQHFFIKKSTNFDYLVSFNPRIHLSILFAFQRYTGVQSFTNLLVSAKYFPYMIIWFNYT